MSREEEITRILKQHGERLRHLETLEPAAGNPQALDVVTTDIEVVNSVVETSVYAFTVPGGTLGTNNLLRLKMWNYYKNATVGTYSILTYRLKYGATTLAYHIIDTVDPGEEYGYVWTFYLKGNGATNAQRGFLRQDRHTHGNEGTSTEDSTQNKNLVITVQHDVADPDISFIRRAATLELMEAL